jgi:SulP family sulfate permease
MISGAAGSVALVAAALVRAHGLSYLLAATILAGALQIVFGLLRLDVLMRFVSRSVRTGFVNALAILIFSAQVPQMLGVSWQTYAMIAAGLAIIYLVHRFHEADPRRGIPSVTGRLVGSRGVNVVAGHHGSTSSRGGIVDRLG